MDFTTPHADRPVAGGPHPTPGGPPPTRALGAAAVGLWLRTSPATVATALLWSASLAALFLADGQVPVFPLVVAGYSAYLAAVGAWLLPRDDPPGPDVVLRANAGGLRLAARCGVVLLSMAFVYTDDLLAAFPGTAPASLLAPVRGIRLAPGVSGFELYRFGTYALLPGALLLALGARPRELGLRLPSRRTALASAVCLLPVTSFVGWGVASGRLSAVGLVALVVHNLLSNGFTEEFQCRGLILSHLRAFLRTGWAQLGQAVAFALLHFHPAGAEEQAAPWRSLAEDLALNLPVALAFGFLALRSRSLVLPTLLHMFRWVP